IRDDDFRPAIWGQPCRKRRLRVAVKIIDNDVLIMDKTSGFDTAVEEAQWASRIIGYLRA
ncbi:phosphofructokinase 5, partial [Prunus dulcis]